jgi:hypothetical protein
MAPRFRIRGGVKPDKRASKAPAVSSLEGLIAALARDRENQQAPSAYEEGERWFNNVQDIMSAEDLEDEAPEDDRPGTESKARRF